MNFIKSMFVPIAIILAIPFVILATQSEQDPLWTEPTTYLVNNQPGIVVAAAGVFGAPVIFAANRLAEKRQHKKG